MLNLELSFPLSPNTCFIIEGILRVWYQYVLHSVNVCERIHLKEVMQYMLLPGTWPSTKLIFLTFWRRNYFFKF